MARPTAAMVTGAAIAVAARASLHSAFAIGAGMPTRSGMDASGSGAAIGYFGAAAELAEQPSPIAGMAPFLGGLCLGLMLVVLSPGAAFADIEDVAVPVDGKGKTTTLTKEQLVRGKRLFVASCANCHVGGGTRTNQNVGLSTEELSGAAPSRANLEGMVNFLNAPTTYDGLYDISENHPSIKSADVFPKMRTMKQKDLIDMSAYILYENQAIPEKWGGGKIYY